MEAGDPVVGQLGSVPFQAWWGTSTSWEDQLSRASSPASQTGLLSFPFGATSQGLIKDAKGSGTL